VFAKLLKQDLGFRKRARRPPTDPVNALLSFGYVLLANQVASAVNMAGLDPYVGFLHGSKYGKPALALDLMEEFRPIVVDSVVLTLINTGAIKQDDFTEVLGAFRLTEAGRKTFLQKHEERLNTTIQHPTFEYKVTYRKAIEVQTRLLGKWLTGEVPDYVPFVVR
jgi:CRISPR-associated protein Cas1